MKKIIVIALLVAFILLIAAIAIGIGSKKVDCSGISDQKTKNRCHLYMAPVFYIFDSTYTLV